MIEDIVTETIYVWRPPCLVSHTHLPSSKIYLALHHQARDLEVNGGVWRGETTDVGYDTFPNGWGILKYNEADHLNRFLYIQILISQWLDQLLPKPGISLTEQWLWV